MTLIPARISTFGARFLKIGHLWLEAARKKKTPFGFLRIEKALCLNFRFRKGKGLDSSNFHFVHKHSWHNAFPSYEPLQIPLTSAVFFFNQQVYECLKAAISKKLAHITGCCNRTGTFAGVQYMCMLTPMCTRTELQSELLPLKHKPLLLIGAPNSIAPDQLKHQLHHEPQPQSSNSGTRSGVN